MDALGKLRSEYAASGLEAKDMDPNPLMQFQTWLDAAVKAGIKEPNAMCLSTVTADGRPSARIVLLKGIEEGHFTFYTNYQSHKGTELLANPACALTFYWPALERQVRIEGVASRTSEERSDAYFHSRPRGSQLGAWASPQSTLLKERDILDARMKDIELRFKDMKVIPRPRQWGGYDVEPVIIEFWQGRANRLHDRLRYLLVEGAWNIYRLAP